MSNYHFETREFGISDAGIHLLRSRFNYDTIGFDQVESVRIERGKELNNWMIILMIGLAFVSFAIYYSYRLYYVIGNHEVRVIYIEEILIPLIPFMLGAYCLYSSMRNGTILRIRTLKQKSEKFPLKELEKENKLMDFQEFIKEKLGVKVSINLNQVHLSR